MTTSRKTSDQAFFNGAAYGAADAAVGRKVREWMRAHPAQVVALMKKQVAAFDRHHGLTKAVVPRQRLTTKSA